MSPRRGDDTKTAWAPIRGCANVTYLAAKRHGDGLNQRNDALEESNRRSYTRRREDMGADQQAGDSPWG